MVAVSVGDEDVANALAVKRLQQRLDVLLISWARINDSDVTPPDHIGARAVEGELDGLRHTMRRSSGETSTISP